MAGTMRVWQVGTPTGPSGLELVERPDPVPGPHDVVVRTRAISLNYRDLLAISGGYGRQAPPGTVPCSDAAGDVVAVGAEVARVRVGDRVTSTFAPGWLSGRLTAAAARTALGLGSTGGVLAEAFVLPEHGVIPAPPAFSCEEAATLPCAALTAWHALFEEAPFVPGTTVLTMGTGGVSVFAAQFAVAAGGRVIATSSRNEKLARLSAFGIHETINYVDTPNWDDRARDLTGGTGVDQVIEIGGEGTLNKSIRSVRPGGTISLIGVLAGSGHVNLGPVFLRNIRLQGIMVGSREMFERMNRGLAARPIAPAIDRVVAFDEAPQAFAHLAGQAHVGKVVIRLE
jgi:NADPH:quinone reductase-like Zn-dependent oxidoreductase